MTNNIDFIKTGSKAFSIACCLVLASAPVAFAEKADSSNLPQLVTTISTTDSMAMLKGAAFNTKTNRVYYLEMGGVLVLDGKTDKVLATISDSRFNSEGIAVDETTNRIYVSVMLNAAQKDQGLLEIDGKTNQIIGTIDLGNTSGGITDLRINQKTRKAYIPHFYGTFNGLQVYDLKARKLLSNIPVPEYAYEAAINEETNKIYITGGEGLDGLVTVIDGKTDTVINKIAAGNAAAPDGCVDVNVYSCTSWGSYLFQLAVNPETNKIYVPAVFEGRVIVIDGKTDKVIDSINVNQYGPGQVAVDTESNTVYVANRNSASLSVIDGHSNKLIGIDSGRNAHQSSKLFYIVGRNAKL